MELAIYAAEAQRQAVGSAELFGNSAALTRNEPQSNPAGRDNSALPEAGEPLCDFCRERGRTRVGTHEVNGEWMCGPCFSGKGTREELLGGHEATTRKHLAAERAKQRAYYRRHRKALRARYRAWRELHLAERQAYMAEYHKLGQPPKAA
jgi:hypothetical protein